MTWWFVPVDVAPADPKAALSIDQVSRVGLAAEQGKDVLLLSVGNGMVLAQEPTGLVGRNRDDNDKSQRWTIEFDEEAKYFCMKNASTGKYAVAMGGSNEALVVPSEKQQWWYCANERDCAPGAVRISPKDYPNACLNHRDALYVPRGQSARVQMWDRWLVGRHSFPPTTCHS